MKTYYGVTSSYDDKGKVIAAITDVVDREEKPKDSFVSTSRRDIYIDWFDTPEEAKRFVEEAKEA